MKRQGVANIFHARFVILKMSVYSRAIAREYNGNRDAQSQNENNNNMTIIINSLESVGMEGTHGYG